MFFDHNRRIACSILPNRALLPTFLLLSLFVISSSSTQASVQKPELKPEPKQQKRLSFNRAINTAQKNDPWLTGNKNRQQALQEKSITESTMADPKMSISLANLPTNGFHLNQEPMTQMKVGFTQMFPRGDTLSLRRQQITIQSEALPFQRQDRQSKVAVTVGSLWLDAYRIQQSIALINKNYSLFEQLVDVAQASYSSTLGKTRQQDIVRAQLELTYLQERLDKFAQQKSAIAGQLSPWLMDLLIADKDAASYSSMTKPLSLSQQMPNIDLLKPEVVLTDNSFSSQQLAVYLNQHPSILALDKNIKATKTGISLAKQKYQPEWGVNVSYAHRPDDPMGSSRADLFSVGLTFDLPLFTENRQDKQVKSATLTTEAVKTDKILLLRKLLAAYGSAKGKLQYLTVRQSLYQSRLLPQINDQAEASLTAYTNDDGDFSEVVRSRIAVLNAEIDKLTIDVEQQKLILELNYLFAGTLAVSPQSTDKFGKK